MQYNRLLIASIATLIVSLLMVFSCAHTKDAVLDNSKYNYERYGWFGPATSVIEDFTWIYYRIPESTDELLRFIDLRIELNGKYAYWGAAKYLKDDIRKKPDNFVFYRDSCLFYPRECLDTVNYVSIYSPKYILERINIEETEDRNLILNRFSTIFYDENDVWLPYDYKITDDLDEKIKEIHKGYPYMLGRNDNCSASWPYRTLFTYKRGSSLSFLKLDIPENNILIYDRENKTTLEEPFKDYGKLDDYMKKLEDLLRNFLKDKPDIHKIMFFAPLVFS